MLLCKFLSIIPKIKIAVVLMLLHLPKFNHQNAHACISLGHKNKVQNAKPELQHQNRNTKHAKVIPLGQKKHLSAKKIFFYKNATKQSFL